MHSIEALQALTLLFVVFPWWCLNTRTQGSLPPGPGQDLFRVLSCMMPEQKHWEEHFIRWPLEVYIPTGHALNRDDRLERQADEETMNSIVEQDSNEVTEEIRRLNEEQEMDTQVLLSRYFRRNTRSKPWNLNINACLLAIKILITSLGNVTDVAHSRQCCFVYDQPYQGLTTQKRFDGCSS